MQMSQMLFKSRFRLSETEVRFCPSHKLPGDACATGQDFRGRVHGNRAELTQTKMSSDDYTESPDFVLSTQNVRVQGWRVLTSHGNGGGLGHFRGTECYKEKIQWHIGRRETPHLDS